MSHSAPYDLCAMITPSHPLKGYRITGRDLKEAKDFLIAGGGEMPDPDTVVSYAKNYFASTFEAWRDQNYPLWGLFRNWNAFAPKPEKTRPRAAAMISCPDHPDQVYAVNEKCPKCYQPVKEGL